MTGHAFIIGGTGQIGRALAADLLNAGWNVTVAHRGIHRPPEQLIEYGARFIAFDRNHKLGLARALGSGADALIDTIAYDHTHAEELIAVQASVGSLVVISSASVYRDTTGRSLDEASQTGFPELPEPIPETNPTVDPGPSTYSTRKVAQERRLLDEAKLPVTILRPCAIYGVGSRHPREWWFVKRMLDGRSVIPLAHRGASRFHTSSVVDIASLTHLAIRSPGTRILNVADPVPPTVSEIASAIADHLRYGGRFMELDEHTYPPTFGRTPWSVPRPFVLDCQAAIDLGYRTATSYADRVKEVCDWLVATAGDGDWRDRFPILANYPWDLFDYSAEDDSLRPST